MSLNITLDLRDALIGLPVVVTRALLTRSEVTVRALVHFLSLALLLVGALRRIEDVLGVHRSSSWHSEGVVLLLSLFRPVIASLVALTEGLSDSGCVLALSQIIKLISKAVKILSLYDDLHRISGLRLFAE